MGIFVNPNNMAMQMDMNTSIYVDKSMIIAEFNKLINSSNRFVCISRPRRFGKSMAGNMASAYYSKGCDSRDLFSGLKLAKDPSFEKYLNKLNVVKFDLNGLYQNAPNKTKLISFINREVVEEMREAFPQAKILLRDSIAAAVKKVYAKTGEQFVVIIDEYDVLVREQVSQKLFDEYLGFLNGLFKNADLAPAIALAYLTGILPIVRDKIQSKLNLFKEYTMTDAYQLSEFVGFTAEETQNLCRQHGMDYDECRRWYDGYDLDSVKEVFSPCSVVNAMSAHKFKSYWTQTGSYEALRNYILLNFDGTKDAVVKMIGGEKVDVCVTGYLNTMTDFKNKDDVFTYLIHLGYLAYDQNTEQCYIPNNEVREQWVLSIKDSADYKPIIDMVNNSKVLVDATIEGDAKAVETALTKAHGYVTSPLSYNNEQSLQSAIGLAFFYATAKYTIIRELPAGKGYADLVLIPYVPNIPAMVIELKNTEKATANTALQQIKDKQYYAALEHYMGDLLLVGVSYNPKTKKHTCRIERMVKE